jgi:hypothetical protein
MFKPKVKIERELYLKLKACSEAQGYSSVEEFVTHVLEKAVADFQEAVSEEEVKRRLQGLGYLG